MPELSDIWNVLLLRDYNTRLVVICTMLLGCACGLMGGFLLLRKRSLMGDTLSHATLPGVGLAFMLAVALGGDGKSLPFLLAGAAVTGVVGCWAVLLIRNHTRIKDDAAMGIVMSVFFGAGVAVLGLIQTMPEGSAAGLESFIYGKTASMVASDFKILVSVTVCVLICSLLLFKEFRLLCFDETFAAALGWPVKCLDVLLLALVTAVTVAGLQAVGLILIIAFLITPAAAARFWTNQLDRMLLLSALIGGASGWLGASLSAFFPRLPAGAVIVLVAAVCFIVSMLVGTERGVLIRYLRQAQLKDRIGPAPAPRALRDFGSRPLGRRVDPAGGALPPDPRSPDVERRTAAGHDSPGLQRGLGRGADQGRFDPADRGRARRGGTAHAQPPAVGALPDRICRRGDQPGRPRRR